MFVFMHLICILYDAHRRNKSTMTMTKYVCERTVAEIRPIE